MIVYRSSTIVVPPDSRDRDPTAWRGQTLQDDVRIGDDIRTVLQRAAETRKPYQYKADEFLHGDHIAEMFRSREYTHARVVYDCGLEANGRIKLLTRGHFWGSDDAHQRFQAQYRRPPVPTETIPFDSYEVWMRYRFGTVERSDGGSIRFVADPDRDGESLRSLDWDSLYQPVQRRLAELELVRNPEFARYRLLEHGEWDDVRNLFRYDPTAFAVGP